MKIVRCNPWHEPFEDMEKFIEEFHPAMSRGFAPAMDIYQTRDSVVVETPLAGVDPEKVIISIENDILTIEGKQEKKTEVDEKEYYRHEVRSGSFHRAVSLPAAVKGETAKAEYEDGILKITIPKVAKAKPKQIKVEIKKKNKK